MPKSGSLTDRSAGYAGESIDNLVLTRIAVEWSTTLAGLRLDSLRQESGDRFRLAFASERQTLSLTVSLDPAHPWMGEAVRRWDGPRWSPDPFVTLATHALEGRIVVGVAKTPADRAVRLMFGDGRALVIELAPHKANVILLAEGGVISGSLRFPKGAKERLAPGRSWTERRLPEGRRDPFGEPADAIHVWGARDATSGQSLADVLERRFIGLGSAGAEAAVAEHIATGRSLGTVLRERLDSILDGTAEVLIDGSRLLPWRPVPAPVDRPLVSRGGPAVTAALFYEARDEDERGRARIAALGAILRSELSRARGAAQKVREGLRSFADPDRHQRMGEALLASLSFAKRSGDVVFVPDPYDPDGRQIAIPAPPEKSLAQIADDLFRLQRRSRRGLAAAGARAEALSQRVSRLETLLSAHSLTVDAAGADSLEHEMRRDGLPVGLTGPTRAARAAARVASPKLAGVRMVTSADGWTILVGRTSRDNDRLTFKIAAPDDFWLHAAGAHGAHVVIRNPDRAPAAPAATLTEAAKLALWFSDARQEAAAEVHWTRRKYVRRAKGGPPGRVVLKRFETLRTRAQAPSGSD